MEKINKFNIRVYAIILENENVLILKEPYAGKVLYKFPGGGLEYGEGVIDCLKRELKEELNLEISGYSHFYTQEDFIQSKFKENEQILTIYYMVKILNISTLTKMEEKIDHIEWIALNKINSSKINLPVDKIVVKKLFKTYVK